MENEKISISNLINGIFKCINDKFLKHEEIIVKLTSSSLEDIIKSDTSNKIKLDIKKGVHFINFEGEPIPIKVDNNNCEDNFIYIMRIEEFYDKVFKEKCINSFNNKSFKKCNDFHKDFEKRVNEKNAYKNITLTNEIERLRKENIELKDKLNKIYNTCNSERK